MSEGVWKVTGRCGGCLDASKGQVRTGQVRTAQVRTGQIRACQVRTGQIKTAEFNKVGQVKKS